MRSLKILVVTDAWHPQVNGVVRSLEYLAAGARDLGATVDLLTTNDFKSWRLPFYPEIRLALALPQVVARHLLQFPEHHIHIATEASLGHAARAACLSAGRIFTSSYHTRLPEYVAKYIGVPSRCTYHLLRRFHAPSAAVMVSTSLLRDELAQRGFQRLAVMPLGVDMDLFKPRPHVAALRRLARPIFLYVGRVAAEKNVEGFLSLDLPGTKVVVGTGPALPKVAAKYPKAVFLGLQTGERLAELYADADTFVFPSRTDTFGLVLLEALASGLPVAAYPGPGSLEIIGTTGAGVVDANLRQAALAALTIPRARCRTRASAFSWYESARRFLEEVRLAQETCSPVKPLPSGLARMEELRAPP
jgi:glycosyltransferase involved in cell wall biosynthesis